MEASHSRASTAAWQPGLQQGRRVGGRREASHGESSGTCRDTEAMGRPSRTRAPPPPSPPLCHGLPGPMGLALFYLFRSYFLAVSVAPLPAGALAQCRSLRALSAFPLDFYFFLFGFKQRPQEPPRADRQESMDNLGKHNRTRVRNYGPGPPPAPSACEEMWNEEGSSPRMSGRVPLPTAHHPQVVAVNQRSSTAHCPQAVWRCTEGVPFPAAPRQRVSAPQELHCPLPPCSAAVHRTISTAHCAQASLDSRGRRSSATGAQHTTHSARQHTHPARFTLPVCKASLLLLFGNSAFGTPCHTTPHDNALHYKTLIITLTEGLPSSSLLRWQQLKALCTSPAAWKSYRCVISGAKSTCSGRNACEGPQHTLHTQQLGSPLTHVSQQPPP